MSSSDIGLSCLTLSASARFRRCLDKNGVTGLILYWGALVWYTVSLRLSVILDIVVVLASLALLFAEPLKDLARRKRTPQRYVAGRCCNRLSCLKPSSAISVIRCHMSAQCLCRSHVGLSLAIVQLWFRVPARIRERMFVLVLGNPLILALEGLIVASRHCVWVLRIFGKFFTGGGIPSSRSLCQVSHHVA